MARRRLPSKILAEVKRKSAKRPLPSTAKRRSVKKTPKPVKRPRVAPAPARKRTAPKPAPKPVKHATKAASPARKRLAPRPSPKPVKRAPKPAPAARKRLTPKAAPKPVKRAPKPVKRAPKPAPAARKRVSPVVYVQAGTYQPTEAQLGELTEGVDWAIHSESLEDAASAAQGMQLHGAFIWGFPEGFGFNYDPNLLDEDKILRLLKRQIRKPTYRQQHAAVRLWSLGKKRSYFQERLFAAFVNGALMAELRRLADEEAIPEELLGEVLTAHFFSP